MKLISMHIDNFGGLHDYDYDFDDGLNIILQDNGWGKTTMAAFLKAMLYGMESKRIKDVTKNERRRYLPWQGGKYGGTLIFEADGVKYKITRTFGERAGSDKVKIVNADTNVTARIDPEKIGDEFFRLDANAFQRSVFITQNGISIDGAASSIHTRLNTLVSQANDVAAYDGAIADLTQQIKYYEKTGDRGKLGDIKKQIAALEKQRGLLEIEIKTQDEDRDRISHIDELLADIEKDLEKRKTELDKVSGETKKREASKKLLDDVDAKISETRSQIDSIKAELGGHIPEGEEIKHVSEQEQSAAALNSRISELKAAYADMVTEHNELLAKYDGEMPKAEQLDEIQSTYGELQGILSTDTESVKNVAEPDGYRLISAVQEEEPDYVSELEMAIGSLPKLQEMANEVIAKEQDIIKDAQSWEMDKKGYTLWSSEVKRLQPELDNCQDYAPEKVDDVIVKLEEVKSGQYKVAEKTEEMKKFILSPEEEVLTEKYADELPDSAECSMIINKIRNADRYESEKQGLKLKIEGEKSRADSLRISIDQMSGISDENEDQPTEPVKSSGTVMIVAGALVAAIGIVLAILMKPVLAAVSAIGVILAIAGAASNNKYKNKLQEYEKQRAEFAKRQEARDKREELKDQLTKAETEIEQLQGQIEELERNCEEELCDARAWIEKWGSPGAECTQTAAEEIAESFERIRNARTKKAACEEIRGSISDAEKMIGNNRRFADEKYPEISEMEVDEAIESLKAKGNKYKTINSQYQNAVRKEMESLDALQLTKEEIENAESPKAPELKEKKAFAEEALSSAVNRCNIVITKIGLRLSADNASEVLHRAEQLLGEYNSFREKTDERDARQQKRDQTIERLENKLNENSSVLGTVYADIELPDRLAMIRKDISKENSLREKISENLDKQTISESELGEVMSSIDAFVSKYRGNDDSSELADILAKAAKCSELRVAAGQLENQKKSILEENQLSGEGTASGEESEIREQILELEKRRDELLVEYTQKSDSIRHADQSLEKYSDVVREIGALYSEKQKAQNTLHILKRSIQLIEKAKENLADRYISKVEQLFNSYMHLWLNNDAVKGVLDIDFNVKIAENDEEHVAEGYSTGYCDLIDFCMRLALVDTLFEKEQPFLIMDDPFVNLDEDRLEKALELLNVLSANKQIVYFVCHPIRATETEDNSISREEFAKLAEDTKKALAERRITAAAASKKAVQKSPRELYKVTDQDAALPVRPLKTDYVITNNIFSMQFVSEGFGIPKDNTYELFFIDEKGHVLNERQIIEISNGKLSSDRLTFSRNTREDSGDQYELMIHESGQDDYDVIARIPFKANLSFASFDF